MPTPSGRPSLMDAILAGETDLNFVTAKHVDVMGDGVKSPLNGKGYTTLHDYKEHLKRNNCEIVGDSTASLRAKRKAERARDAAKVAEAIKETRGLAAPTWGSPK